MPTLKSRRCLLALAGVWVALGMLADRPTGAAEPDRLMLAYEVYSGGFHILALDLDLALAAQKYDVTARVRTTGMLSWFIDWTQIVRSTGAFRGPLVAPVHHLSEGAFRGRQRHVEIAYAGGEIASIRLYPLPRDDEDREEVSETQRLGTIDPISAILAVVRAVSDGHGCNARVPVFDGRRRYDLIFADRGPQPVRETRYAVFSGAARQCDFAYEPIAGHTRRATNPETNRRLDGGRAWLAPVIPGAPATPVRVELDGDWALTVAHLREVRSNLDVTSGSAR